MKVSDTEEFGERVKALRGVHGVIPAKRMVRRAMILEELEAIQKLPTDPAVWRLADVLEEMMTGDL